MPELVEILESLSGQNLFFTFTPETLDITNPMPFKITFITPSEYSATFPVSKDKRELMKLLSQLKHYVTGNRTIITWNIKNFLSYVNHVTGMPFDFDCSIYDLKVLGAMSNLCPSPPKTFNEAREALLTITHYTHWEKIVQVYKEVYLPLILKILPEIESVGLIDKSQGCIVHPCYEVEGQINGRMKCFKGYKYSFNPHIIAETERNNLRPVGYENNFIMCDFSHMEVSTLQWLTKDKLLGDILASGDAYEGIWTEITGEPASPKVRTLCKNIFLPVVYGLGWYTLSKELGLDEITSKELVKRIGNKFKTAMEWAESQQAEAEMTGSLADHFGRVRTFNEKFYTARNFAVQSPAAIVCLHKLVVLAKNIRNICFHVHDGYCIIADDNEIKLILDKSKEALESADPLYLGLKLRAKFKFGKTLNFL